MINVVVSGVNLTEGGILSIAIDFLKELIKHEEYSITVLVHDKNLFSEIQSSNLTYIEYPNSKSNWLTRLYYEYVYFKYLSKKLNADIWFSMHDITPNVSSKFLVTYCHNPTPFYKTSLKDLFLSYKVFLFSLFYKYLYKINIKKNDMLVVQQDWIKTEFTKMFKVSNIYVANPSIPQPEINHSKKKIIESNLFSFFYPSFPRVFKNFEVICKAVEYLYSKNIKNFEVYLTIDGTENTYTQRIVRKFKKLSNIKFIGLQKREDVFNYYKDTNVLIFPSKLETWGLPISEFKLYNKPIIASCLDYAKETVGKYDKVNFFDPNNYHELADLIEDHIKHNVKFDENKFSYEEKSDNWNTFIELVKRKYIEKGC